MSADDYDDIEEALHGTFVNLGAAVIEPPKWVIDNVLPVGLTIIGAPPKAYKSVLTIGMACAVAGIDVGDKFPSDLLEVEDGGRVLLFSGENSSGAVRFIIEKGFGASINNHTPLWIADDNWKWRLDDDAKQERMLQWLDAAQPRLVIIDPLRNFHGQKENESDIIINLLTPIRAWAMRNNAAVVVVHHTKKLNKDPRSKEPPEPTPDDLRGSGALFGACDGLLLLHVKNKKMVIDTVYRRGVSWKRDFDWKVDFGVLAKAAMMVTPEMRRAVAMLDDGKTWGEVQTEFNINPNKLAKWKKLVKGEAK